MERKRAEMDAGSGFIVSNRSERSHGERWWFRDPHWQDGRHRNERQPPQKKATQPASGLRRLELLVGIESTSD